MRLGLLGLGRIGAFHAETLAGLPAVEELVISDPVSALAEQVADRLGARIAGSPEAVLASGVDGMIIAAPTGFHTELIELCVAAGLPTFCEKPVARDSDKAAQLARCGCRPRRAAPERAGCRVLPPPLTENCRRLSQARWHGCRKPPGERAACPRSTA